MKPKTRAAEPPPPVLCGECHRAWPAACVCPKPPPEPPADLAARIAAGLVAVAIDGADAGEVIASLASEELRQQRAAAWGAPRCVRCHGYGCQACHFTGRR